MPDWSKLDGITAEQIMSERTVSIETSATLAEALDLMTEHNVSGLPVSDNDKWIGVISATDILRHASENADAGGAEAPVFDPDTEQWEAVQLSAFGLDDQSGQTVSELVNRNLISCEPDYHLTDVARMMAEHKVRRLLVITEGGDLLGVVSATDVARAVARAADG